MSALELVVGGATAVGTPAGLVLLPFVIALGAVLPRASPWPRVAASLVALAAVTGVALRWLDPVAAHAAASFASPGGVGTLARMAGLTLLVVGAWSWRERALLPAVWPVRFAATGLALACLRPPVAGPVLAASRGPWGAAGRGGDETLYHLGFALTLSLLCLAAHAVARRVDTRWVPRLGAAALAVGGLLTIFGWFQRGVEIVLLRWPVSGGG